MYNVKAVTESLRGLIGFRQHDDEQVEDIDAELTLSRSGLYLDGAHALITARNLSGAAVVFTHEQTLNNLKPLNALITRTLDDSVASVLSALRTRKLSRYEGRVLLPATPLYEGEGSLFDLIQPAGRFVGLQLQVSDPGLALTIPRLGLQLTGTVTELPIVVLSGGDLANVQEHLVTTTAANRMQWIDTNIVLTGSTQYIIGYREDNVPVGVQAVRRARSIGRVPCAGCQPQNDALWQRWGSFVSVATVRNDSGFLDVFDEVDNQNYGLNLAVSVGCDWTGLVITQQAQLAEAIRQQAVVSLLNQLAYSTQITTIEQQTRQSAVFALKNGEESKLEKLLDALDIDLSGVSRCLPDPQQGQLVRRTTLWNR